MLRPALNTLSFMSAVFPHFTSVSRISLSAVARFSASDCTHIFKGFSCEYYLNIVPLDLLSVLGKQFRRHDLALLILSVFLKIFGFRNLFCAKIMYVI